MQESIKIEGITEINKVLNDVQEHLDDTTPLLAELSNFLYNMVDESFEYQTAPDGKKWSPIKKRAGDNHPNKILYNTGNMQNSLTRFNRKTEAGVSINATHNGFPYGLSHQFGTTNGKIEPRPFFPIKNNGELYKEAEAGLNEILEEFLDKILK